LQLPSKFIHIVEFTSSAQRLGLTTLLGKFFVKLARLNENCG